MFKKIMSELKSSDKKENDQRENVLLLSDEYSPRDLHYEKVKS